jgi:hypothetical protein
VALVVGEGALDDRLALRGASTRLLTKLQARDRAQLVMLAYEAGVVAPGVP